MHVLLLALAILAQTPQAAPAPDFAGVASASFEKWDQDGNGELSADEVDRLCVDPGVRGPEAAAAAAVKRIIRSDRYAVPPLTLENLVRPAPPARRERDGIEEDSSRSDSPEIAVRSAERRPPNFQASYSSSLRRITSTKRDLFLDETPDVDKCRQGPLGNCYFVAPIGALVHRDPSELARLVVERDDGGYDVRFRDGQSISLAPLTDAEIALSGTTGDEGLWLPVLEKAFGTLRRNASPARYTTQTPTDAIAMGGSAATTIRMLTGHQAERVVLKRRPRSTEKDAQGKPVELPPEPAGDLADLAERVRTKVFTALAGGRLVACGTGTEPQPPGISGKHAYAVIAFDAGADALTLWNPHGNTFRPKGDPGLEAGYATRAGVFTVPIDDFVRIFTGVTIETDRAYIPPSPRPAQPGT